jgi:twitching motility protein PilT
MLEHKKILAEAVARKASDVHINVGIPPILRINTELMITDFPVVTNEDARGAVLEMVGQERFAKFERRRDLDFSTTIENGTRFRVNAHFQRDTIGLPSELYPAKYRKLTHYTCRPL